MKHGVCIHQVFGVPGGMLIPSPEHLQRAGAQAQVRLNSIMNECARVQRANHVEDLTKNTRTGRTYLAGLIARDRSSPKGRVRPTTNQPGEG